MTLPEGVPEELLTVAEKITGWPYPDVVSDEVKVICDVAVSTVCVKTGEVLPFSLPLPEKTAAMACWPNDKVEVEKLATPSTTGLTPSVTVPSLNVIDPPSGVGRTKALNLTTSPTREGLGEEDKLTVVFAVLTV